MCPFVSCSLASGCNKTGRLNFTTGTSQSSVVVVVETGLLHFFHQKKLFQLFKFINQRIAAGQRNQFKGEWQLVRTRSDKGRSVSVSPWLEKICSRRPQGKRRLRKEGRFAEHKSKSGIGIINKLLDKRDDVCNKRFVCISAWFGQRPPVAGVAVVVAVCLFGLRSCFLDNRAVIYHDL